MQRLRRKAGDLMTNDTSPTSCPLCELHDHHTSEPCQHDCRSREATHGPLCHPCLQRIRNNLDTIQHTWELSAEPPTLTNTNTTTTTGRPADPPLPGGTDWIDWRNGADLQKLNEWVDDWSEHLGTPPPNNDSLAATTGWLRRHLDKAALTHPAITDFHDEIHALARRGQTITGEIQPRKSRVICPTHTCTKQLHLDVHDLHQLITCPRCRIARSCAQILNLLNDHDAWVDVEVAAMRTKIPARTLQHWAKRGHIQRRKGLYQIGNILDHKTTA